MPKQKRSRVTVACFSCGRTQTMRPSRLQACNLYHCGPTGCAKTGAQPDHPEAVTKRIEKAAGSFTGIRYNTAKLPKQRSFGIIIDMSELNRNRRQYSKAISLASRMGSVHHDTVSSGVQSKTREVLCPVTPLDSRFRVGTEMLKAVGGLRESLADVVRKKADEGRWKEATQLLRDLQPALHCLHLSFLTSPETSFRPDRAFMPGEYPDMWSYWAHLKFNQYWSRENPVPQNFDPNPDYRTEPVVLVIRELDGVTLSTGDDHVEQRCKAVSAVCLHPDRMEPLGVDDVLHLCKNDVLVRRTVPLNSKTRFLSFREHAHYLLNNPLKGTPKQAVPAFTRWAAADRLVAELSRMSADGLHCSFLREPGADSPMAAFNPVTGSQMSAFWEDAKYRAGEIGGEPGVVLILRRAERVKGNDQIGTHPRRVGAVILRPKSLEFMDAEKVRKIDRADTQGTQTFPLDSGEVYAPFPALLRLAGFPV